MVWSSTLISIVKFKPVTRYCLQKKFKNSMKLGKTSECCKFTVETISSMLFIIKIKKKLVLHLLLLFWARNAVIFFIFYEQKYLVISACFQHSKKILNYSENISKIPKSSTRRTSKSCQKSQVSEKCCKNLKDTEK